ncbi:uncharacterized protein LOC105286357 isoform X3 [Ooceraea biroi]|uniref:uncharacterized protein LOC105286357 isoform X3 n=1 Tax=Ooceraea biroi TaxID=2015173 RepID=UPI000F0914CA|nr:uncharacterized protein LOC105286357 isoform X3 [Ooceraea biroi]
MGTRKPIRTYQRKIVKNSFVGLSALPVRTIKKYDPVENVQTRLDKSGTFIDESLNYDPFETTFDRLAKDAIVPPLPPDANRHDSSNRGSSESDTSNVTNIKSPEHDAFTLFADNGASSLMHKSVKLGRRCNRSRKSKLNAPTSKTKAEQQKRQASKMQKRSKMAQNISNEPDNKCDEQRPRSKRDTTSRLKNAVYDESDVLHHSCKKILKTDEVTTTLQTMVDGFVTDLKCVSSNLRNVKPCFVKLVRCIDQNSYEPNTEKSVADTRIKRLQRNEDINEIVHNTDSRSNSTEYNGIIENFRNISLKSCSVVLCDDIRNCREKCINGYLDKSVVSSSVFHDSSKIVSRCSDNVKLAIRHHTEGNGENIIIRDSFVRLEKLKREDFLKKDRVTSNERKRQMVVSSTPIDKLTRVRPSTCSVLLSPIDTKEGTSHFEQNFSVMTEKNVLNFTPSANHSNKKIRLSIAQSEDCKFDVADIHEQQTQILCSSQSTRIMEDFVVKTETISFEEDIYTANTQKYNMEDDAVLPCSLNTFAATDQSRSLFSTDTTYDHSTRDAVKNEIKEQIDEMISFPVDLRSEQEWSDKALLSFNFYQQPGGSNLERSKSTSSNQPFHQVESKFDTTVERYSDSINAINRQIEKSIFLKPGKSWTRSLSILNNINDECNLDKLSLGKGRKWRNSVRDLLDMQKQGIVQSCCEKQKDDLPSPDVSNRSSFDIDRHETFNSTNHVRFSKRISVRVVPNDTSVNHEVKDVPFLEAFGINSKLSHQTQSATRDDLIRKHSTTAKDVVLKKCSQQRYLPFSRCFPKSYLMHCRKIGEGVYGEVFLYENNFKKTKSVIKIIPIEGKELVNGEPQKKFNEILSEIVIAQELSNLRSNDVCRTGGFVEVKNIKCIIGTYPKKLVKLWNAYDEEKTSDNDCPSMFDKNQLYIALELGHGGEDLEAFVFQTADETCALFFQVGCLYICLYRSFLPLSFSFLAHFYYSLFIFIPLQIAFALAVAERALEFEHRDLHWGNVLISKTTDKYIYYKLDEKEIRLLSNGVRVSIIDFTLSRMLYQQCCIYNDLALDPALFTAHGEYQFEIYRLMRDKLQNNWREFEPYTNILWLHYILDKMITMVRYKRKDLRIHDYSIGRLKELKNLILNYDSTYDFVTNYNDIPCRCF